MEPRKAHVFSGCAKQSVKPALPSTHQFFQKLARFGILSIIQLSRLKLSNNLFHTVFSVLCSMGPNLHRKFSLYRVCLMLFKPVNFCLLLYSLSPIDLEPKTGFETLPRFEQWSPGTESQCATNELC